MINLIRYVKRLLVISIRQMDFLFRKRETKKTFIFHHLPRCGGTSLRKSIKTLKHVYNDYRFGWGKVYPIKYPIDKFNEDDCLSGHFELEGYHLFQRYPEVFENSRYKIFTFIREPLDLCISHYYYKKKNGQKVHKSINFHILSTENYLAGVLNVNKSNYKRILDRYDFIGIFERYDESLKQLSLFFGSGSLDEIKINQAERSSSVNTITEDDINLFKEKNSLDYLIYDYCIERFRNENI
jgi:hypothetical protein